MSTLARETVEEWRARMETKRQQNAYFRDLNESAVKSQKQRPTTIKTKLTKQATKPREPAPDRKCATCEMPLPPESAGNRKYCSTSCSAAYWNGRRENRARNATIGECPGCKRPTRPKSVPANDAPGTVPRAQGEHCADCASGRFRTRIRGDISQPDDPRHGTQTGARAHRRAGEKPCPACAEGQRREQRKHAKEKSA